MAAAIIVICFTTLSCSIALNLDECTFRDLSHTNTRRFLGLYNTKDGIETITNKTIDADWFPTMILAPNMFRPQKDPPGAVLLDSLIGEGCVINLATMNLMLITRNDLKTFYEDEHGPISGNCIVAIATGWTEHYGTEKYLGFEDNGVYTASYPVLSDDAVQYLTQTASIQALILDTPNVDLMPNTTKLDQFLAQDIPVFVNAKNLEGINARGSTIVALPVKQMLNFVALCRIVVFGYALKGDKCTATALDNQLCFPFVEKGFHIPAGGIALLVIFPALLGAICLWSRIKVWKQQM